MIRDVHVCQLCACRVSDYRAHYWEVHEKHLENERYTFATHGWGVRA